MKIVIKESNAERITEAIKEAEGKARERRCGYYALEEAIKDIENTLKISKVALNGTTATICPHAHTFPNAYHGFPMGTVFHVEFMSGTWKLINVCRENINQA